jgi:glyoxylase-like metal-dependent hydrolase (beta-lactamase superfamily II)
MRLYVVHNGKQAIDKSLLVAGCANATVDNKNPDAVWQDIPIHTFLIEHSDGYVLFDTACDPDFERTWPEFIHKQSPYVATKDQHLLTALAMKNIKPEDIKYVIMSHLHVDHAGNLGFFRNARVFVNNAEFVTTLRQFAMNTNMNVHAPNDVRRFLDAGLDWRPVMEDEDEVEVVPGITAVNLGSGHSWGMLAMRVDLPKSGTFLMVADALYMAENYGPPVKVPGIIHDSLGFLRTAEYIRNYSKKYKAKVLFGHDMEQFNMLKKYPDEYYE